MATVLVCAFFTSFTGASAVTILALGGLLYPVLLQNGFTPRFAVGLLTASGSIGLLFPPSLPVILLRRRGADAHRPDVPGRHAARHPDGRSWSAPIACVSGGVPAAGLRPHAVRAPPCARSGRPAPRCILPVVILVSVFGGFATLVEAAALTALLRDS